MSYLNPNENKTKTTLKNNKPATVEDIVNYFRIVPEINFEKIPNFEEFIETLDQKTKNTYNLKEIFKSFKVNDLKSYLEAFMLKNNCKNLSYHALEQIKEIAIFWGIECYSNTNLLEKQPPISYSNSFSSNEIQKPSSSNDIINKSKEDDEKISKRFKTEEIALICIVRLLLIQCCIFRKRDIAPDSPTDIEKTIISYDNGSFTNAVYKK